jgi:perosamine synthetase
MNMHIPVSRPCLDDAEKLNVVDALNKGAISGFYGEYIPRFEEEFAAYSGCKYGVATTSGTTALHLAMAALSIGKDDEVLVSTLTNMATFFAVIYQGARPVPIDIEEDTFNIDTTLLESKITPRTRAILVVHLFGHPVDMDPVTSLAKKYNLYVIEDCAQAHGATYKGRKVGGIGDIGCFSFYANKIITTGEGGMITTNNAKIADRARSLKSLAFGKSNKFMHTDVGYNYRMTNVQAAIGCAQFGKIENMISNKRKIAAFYTDGLSSLDTLQLPLEKAYARNVYWMYHINLLGPAAAKREHTMKKLLEWGIETREGFIPYNMQEIFIKRGWVNLEDCPKANRAALSSFYLPSGPLLTEEELEYVVIRLKSILRF